MRTTAIFKSGLLGSMLLAAAAGAAVRPAAQDWPVLDLPQVAQYASPAVDAADLADEDAWRVAQQLPYRFALPDPVRLTPGNSGTWETLPDGRVLWRLRVASPGALSLNLGFTAFHLPPGVRLLVYAAAGGGAPQVYDERDNAPHAQLWTPVILADEIVVELVGPADLRADVVLELASIGRGYRFFGEPAKSGTCNIDVICPEGDAWRDEIDTVAMISRLGYTLCTGALVNNTAADGRPLLLTAYHCGVTESAAPTLVAYWNFQSPTCGAQGGGSLDETTTGSTLLATYQPTDFTLVELDENPEVAYSVKFAGWNRGPEAPTAAVCIHHPSTDEKSISFENDPLVVTSYEPVVGWLAESHLRVNDWDLGTTEGGSSGSPLFDPEHRVVGQLHGGWAACGNNEPDYYGRLSMSWTGGGTPDTRLSDWLDPLGTGAVTVDLLEDPRAAGFTVTPAGGLTVTGVAGGDVTPSSLEFTLANAGLAPAAFTAVTDVAWLTATPPDGTVPAEGQILVTVGFTAAVRDLAAGRHVGRVVFANLTGGPGAGERTVTVTLLPPTLAVSGAAPNPFRGYTEVMYSLPVATRVTWRIFDMRGALVRATAATDGVFGDNRLAWDGTGDDGRRLPAGKYIIEIRAFGGTQRTAVVLIR